VETFSILTGGLTDLLFVRLKYSWPGTFRKACCEGGGVYFLHYQVVPICLVVTDALPSAQQGDALESNFGY